MSDMPLFEGFGTPTPQPRRRLRRAPTLVSDGTWIALTTTRGVRPKAHLPHHVDDGGSWVGIVTICRCNQRGRAIPIPAGVTIHPHDGCRR